MYTSSSGRSIAVGLVAAAGTLVLACSDSTLTPGSTGGASSTGGSVSTGGVHASGGIVATGGNGTGGLIPGTGGKGTGGSSPTTGGITASGGMATGGTRTGGAGPSTGGKPGTGGVVAVDGGSGTGGAGGQSTTPSGDAVKSSGCGTETTAKTGKGFSITVGGSARTYNLRIPDSYDKDHPYRLIVSYHWLGGTANNVTDGGVAKPYYGLWDLAQNSTIFVAPQGISNGWNNSGGADVEFSRQLITQLESTLCIDKSRIFCEGFSMGGSMSYAMACGMGDVIRGVAVHSGGTMSGCAKHDKPVAYFMTHGIKDSVCTYPGFALPPLQDFAKMNGCKSPDPTLSQSAFEALLPEPTSTASACIDFTGCQQGYPVRSCLFVGDHTPSPDGTNGWVPKESWKFISQF